MNIDFSADATFSAYVCLLIFSGIAMLVASAAAKQGTRILDVLFGLGFLGYGFYLAFLFDGGSYAMFFYAFILPVMMIYRTIKERFESSAAPAPVAEPTDAQATQTP
jgi:hypothetical protein